MIRLEKVIFTRDKESWSKYSWSIFNTRILSLIKGE